MKVIYTIVGLLVSLNALASIGVEQRVAPSTGAVFIRDTSNPELGEAFRDPSGVVWGSLHRYPMALEVASEFCKARNARVPTIQEFEQLSAYLGKESAEGYNPYLNDGATDFLPGLTKGGQWTSATYPSNPDGGHIFSGADGTIVKRFWGVYPYWVRCVSGR